MNHMTQISEEALDDATRKYEGLEWQRDDIRICTPKCTEDFDLISNIMTVSLHGYINHVRNGSSKILIVFKEIKEREKVAFNTPHYMILEIQGNRIVQARKYKNGIPDKNDMEWLRQYADDKNLEIGFMTYRESA